MHPADELEPEQKLQSVKDLVVPLFWTLPGGPDLARVRASWPSLAGVAAERSWPSRIAGGVLYIEAAGTAAQDLRLLAAGLRKKLAELQIRIEKVVVELPDSNRIQNDPRRNRG